jgi:hypothetical protein
LTAIEMSHGRSLSGSRIVSNLRQAIVQADWTASSVTSASPPVTTKQTLVMSAWWASTIRAKAISSPFAALLTSAATPAPLIVVTIAA